MTALLPVEEAQARLFALRAPLPGGVVDFYQALGRYISHDISAKRDQPAADVSAMDGYAIRFADLPGPWTVTGVVAAGAVPDRSVGPGEAMRIFTGAPLPAGADTVVVQEDVQATGNRLELVGDGPNAARRHVRPQGSDFRTGAPLLAAGTRLSAGAIAVAAMSGVAALAVGGRARIAIVTTGDELVPPGHPAGPGQIPNSNGVMLAALLAGEPADVSMPLHVGDDRRATANIFKELARHHDVIVTVGGASVGDHDHVRDALADAGGALDFWKIAMRPGKPLIAGRIGETVLLGLPGNPGSAFVTAHLFLLPLVRHLAGAGAPLPPLHRAPLATPLGPGGARRDYLRARLEGGVLHPFGEQDSGATHPLAAANALVVREIGAPAAAAGSDAVYVAL